MSKGSLSPGQDVVIETFVNAMLRVEHPDLKVDEWPDRHRAGEIDAVAGPYAIEHTSVDSVPNQRQHNAWFSEIHPASADFPTSIQFRASIFLPWDEMAAVRDRPALRAALTTFINRDLQVLDFGDYQLPRSDAVPIGLWVWKRSDMTPGIFFGRALTTNDASLPSRVAEAIRRKAAKLRRYRHAGMTTLLLLESEDITLMNQGIMLEAIQRGLRDGGLPSEIDQLWFADTALVHEMQFHNFTRRAGSTTDGRNACQVGAK